MQTDEGPVSRYRHTDTRPWTDSTGHEWAVEVHWYEVQGRYEPTRIVLDSSGKRAATSTVLRQFEQELGRRREAEAQSLAKVVNNARPEIAERAQRQLDKWLAEQPGRGRQPAHDLWLARVLVLYWARVAGEPMSHALQRWESERVGYDVPEATIRTYMTRARAWEREVGLGLLAAPVDDLSTRQRAHRMTKVVDAIPADEPKSKARTSRPIKRSPR